MGTDCTMIVERRDYSIPTEDRQWWDTIGCCHLPRNYDFYEEISNTSTNGYPPFINWLSESILEEVECWGECYMSYEDFEKLANKYNMKKYVYIRKKEREHCRCIFRFDN